VPRIKGEFGLALTNGKGGESRAIRRSLLLAIIVTIVVLLVGVTLETGILGSAASSGGNAVNSATTPFTGEEVHAAYASNWTKAQASYTNKTVYFRDTLDLGVGTDSVGQYYSYFDSGAVILFWSDVSQLSQLHRGTKVLAKCLVAGEEFSPGPDFSPGPGPGYFLYLQDCDLISVLSQSVSATNE
jgi:hypothetical protein